MNDKLAHISNFIVFYGSGNVDNLLLYDLLVLEAKGQTVESLATFKKAGKMLAAYVSIVEISEQDEMLPLLCDDDFIKINNQRIINEEYHTFYMDISKEKVQNILIYKMNALLENGYDGIFLDTIGNIEYLNIDDGLKVKLMEGAVFILKQIKGTFSGAILIQNNGLESLCDYTANYLDAICLENPPVKTIGNLKWTYGAFLKLNHLNKEHHLTVLLLQEFKKSKKSLKSFALKKIADIFGYLYYQAPKFYQ